jgi:Phage portal protein, SPP1 Gp6-like
MVLAEQQMSDLYLKWALKAISEAQEDYQRFEDYYMGEHELEFATDRWKDVFGTVFEEFSDNWCQVVVDSVVHRMEIDGWKSEDDDDAALLAEDIWDRNTLEVEEDDLHTQTLVKGDAYLICQPDPENESQAQIFYNDALDVSVQYDSSNRRKLVRAAKRYTDADGSRWICIYTPERIQKWEIPSNTPEIQVLAVAEALEILPSGWLLREDFENQYGEVPVFHFKNRALGSTHGISELKNVIPMQNSVNKLLMDMMVGSEFGHYRQKYIAGGGHPKDGWKAGAMRLWATTDPNAKFGEFGQIDLESVTRAIDLVVGHIGKTTMTPMHYLRSSGDMPSGEALKTAESGLIKKCIGRQKQWGAAWSKAMSFAILIETGSQPLSPVKPVWQSPETRHVLEQAQTAQLKSVLGIPLEILWSEHFGYTEEEIAQFKDMNKATAAAVLARVIAQAGQLPPGAEQVTATPDQLIALLNKAPQVGNEGDGQGLDISQILALLPKSITAQTTAGEATTRPQPNTRPPASPTRRSSGFKD